MRTKIVRIVGDCGPDHSLFSIAFRELDTRLGFVYVSVSIRIRLFHARFKLLYEEGAFGCLKDAIERKAPLAGDLVDADGILRLKAVIDGNDIIWDLEWKGIYPSCLSDSSENRENAILTLSNLRVPV